MKYLGYVMTIATTAIGLAMPFSVRGQSIPRTPGIERVPLGGFYSTTTYTPSPDNVTTNVTTQIGTGNSYLSNYSPFTTPVNSAGGKDRPPKDIQYHQPIVNYQQPSNYPQAILTRCVLKTLSDAERSLVAVDRYTGKPCD